MEQDGGLSVHHNSYLITTVLCLNSKAHSQTDKYKFTNCKRTIPRRKGLVRELGWAEFLDGSKRKHLVGEARSQGDKCQIDLEEKRPYRLWMEVSWGEVTGQEGPKKQGA